jgi:predicted kinase
MTGPAEPQDLQRGSSADVIARHIRNEIESGKLRHEQQLPSTRKLAETWGTSVATINRAMGMLADQGLVINRARSSRLVHYPPGTNGQSEPRSAKVILIGGYAGSGKTELGRVLARNTGWPILDKDTTTRPVVEVALETLGHSPHDRDSDFYFKHIRPAEYDALIATVTENVDCGVSVIATAPFIRELNDQAWCDRLAAGMASRGAELHVIWVRCDADTMRTYIRHRGAARDAAKLADWNAWIGGVDLDFRPMIEHSVIDNSADSRPLQDQAAEFLSRIQQK